MGDMAKSSVMSKTMGMQSAQDLILVRRTEITLPNKLNNQEATLHVCS